MELTYKKDWNPREHYQSATVAGSYDAERFNSVAGRVLNWLERRLVRNAFRDIPRPATIADIPCGTGRLAETLLDSGLAVVGMDISPSMLDQARLRLERFGPRFQTEVRDARTLQGTPPRFDGVLCARVLMHFPFEEQVEFLRCAAGLTNGRVVFTQGIDSGFHRLRRRAKRMLGNQAPAAYPLTRHDLDRLIEASGLRLLRRHWLLPVVSESVVVVAEVREPTQRITN
jgi:2-polyprenyl-3-methyl-5-hydroxy-6-metoxy-1,4-benzoquinol methylase